MKSALTCVPFLTLAALAQSPPAPPQVPRELSWGVDVYRVPGTQHVSYSSLAPARIGDDDELDVVAVRKVDGVTGVVAYAAPMRHNVEVTVATGIVDAAVLVTGQPRDPVVVLRSTGLEAYRALPGEQETATASIASIGGSWAGAGWLSTGRDATGAPVVFGTNAAGTKVLRARWDGQTLQPLAELDTVPGVTRVQTMNWDGEGEPELVVQLGALVVVTHWDGSPITSFVFDSAHQYAVTVSRGTGTAWYARDLLIAYGWLNGQYQLLAAAGIPNSQVPMLALRSFGVNCGWTANDLQAFDLDSGTSPQLQDLVLANHNDSGLQQTPQDARAWVVRRVNDASVFAAPEVMPMVAGIDLQDRPLDKVCGADFDGDGDGDVIAMQSAVLMNQAELPTERSVMQVFASNVSTARRPFAEFAVPDEPEDGVPMQLHVCFGLPIGWQTLAAGNEVLRIECVGWFANEGVPEPVASIVHTYDVPPSGVLPEPIVLQREAGPSQELIPDQWEVIFHTRLVVVGPAGERRYSTRVTHFSPNTTLSGNRKLWVGLIETGERHYGGEPGEPNTNNGSRPPTQQPVPRP